MLSRNNTVRMRIWQLPAAALLLVLVSLPAAWAQQPEGPSAAPPAAVGQDASNLGSNQNPPLSSLDQPSLEPGGGTRNFLQPAVLASESVDTNIGNALNSSAIHGITRAFGSLLLERNWKRAETSLAYVGGGQLYTGYSRTGSLIQAFDGEQRLGWRTGQFVVRDIFSYLPEGAFGAPTAYGLGSVGETALQSEFPSLFNSQQFASFGEEPRITNMAAAEISQSFSPRSALTMAGGYGLIHFLDNNVSNGGNGVSNGGGFIDSNSVRAQVAYNYQITRKDLVALSYAYLDFAFPNLGETLASQFAGATIRTQIVSLMYGHRISGRLDFSLGAGPQFTHITQPNSTPSNDLTPYVTVLLRYRLSRTSLSLNYTQRNTSGSGLALGTQSDIGRLSATHVLSRSWELSADLGYAHNRSLIAVPVTLGIPGLPPGSEQEVVEAQRFDRGFVGLQARYRFNRYLSSFVSYTFDDLSLNRGACQSEGSCGSQRHLGVIGVEWHPRPIRLE